MAFLEKIRSSPRGTRVRWLIILSGLSFIVVAGVWIISIKALTTRATAEPVTDTATAAGKLATFGGQLKDILGEIRLRTGNAFDTIKGALGTERELELSTSTNQ